tara:strand:+ start:5418 stop:6356 length:939 start_codon:yes stop_codon:yes gene_type:complete
MLFLVVPNAGADNDNLFLPDRNKALFDYLQDISVTVRAPGPRGVSEGSGVIFTRKVRYGNRNETVNFVWTAAHVIDNLRSVRSVVDPKTGETRKIVEFKDPQVVKDIMEGGRLVGEISMDAKVICYSDADTGEDLALLLIRKRSFISKNSVKFYLGGPEIPSVGTDLYHVGSLLGKIGSNSLTRGMISKTGRVLPLGNGSGVVFDQTTVTAFPGSSGGGVYLGNFSEEHRGKCVGLLVRGAGENFNLIVPIRRLKSWAGRHNLSWALDPNVEAPSMSQIAALPVEDNGPLSSRPSSREREVEGTRFLIREIK